MGGNKENFILFGGSSHPTLCQDIAKNTNLHLGECILESFPDRELFVQIIENVRGKDIFLVQSIVEDPNTYIMELLIMIDALKRSSVNSICVVMPYYGYQRQDRKDRSRVAITAKLVANLLETAGANRVLTLDLHADQIQGFFDVPLDNLVARPALVYAIDKYIEDKNRIVMAPDVGSIKMAREYASCWGCDLAVIDKRRQSSSQVEVMNIIGDVRGKEVILVDDICSTAGTLVNAAEACHAAGAAHVYACVTHGVFAHNALEKVEESHISRLFVTDTVPMTSTLKHPKIQLVTVAPLISEALSCIMSDRSISSLFKKKAADDIPLSLVEASS
jgi:ribose-phosphate pyrophosphokinase